jgi:hypothetical protein
MKGIALEDANVRLYILAIHFSQIAKANGYLQLDVQNFPIFFYCSTLSILKSFLKENKNKMDELDIFAYF